VSADSANHFGRVFTDDIASLRFHGSVCETSPIDANALHIVHALIDCHAIARYGYYTHLLSLDPSSSFVTSVPWLMIRVHD